MLLVIDVGNTNTVFGIYNNDTLLDSFRMTTNKNRTADETGLFICEIFRHAGIDMKGITAVIISSVVPPVMYSIMHCIRKYFGFDPIIVDSSFDLGMKVLTDNPAEVGADRLVNAIAAYSIYGGPVMIIDFGTATTICAVNGSGDYLGGAICPGIIISVEALYQNTAKLPRIELNVPERVIGTNTVMSMQSGVIHGYRGQIQRLIELMKKELDSEAKTVATGGLARMIVGNSGIADIVDSRLTLEGLRIIYDRMECKK